MGQFLAATVLGKFKRGPIKVKTENTNGSYYDDKKGIVSRGLDV